MKGVIVAAGYGTRFLPVTKTVPKEMLPLGTKPSIAWIVEEFLESGIREIVIISSRRKKSMEDYFDREAELEAVFGAEKAEAKLQSIKPYDADISFVRQQEMRGTGHALLCVKPFIGDSPFVVAYPDDLVVEGRPLTSQLIETHKETGCSVLASIHNPPDIHRYGVLDLADDGLHVRHLVEKPAPGKEPSKEVSIGRYLYTPDFLGYIEEGWKKHTGNEYYHTYALDRQMEKNGVVFKRAEGRRLDTGSPEGYLEAYLWYASRDPKLKKVIEQFKG
jgi:UTP--glucose-1-phosphate uridylyltransferase